MRLECTIANVSLYFKKIFVHCTKIINLENEELNIKLSIKV